MKKMIKQIIKLIRIKQWIKNTFVLAPLLFSLNFVNFELCIKSGLTFLAFSFSASIIYIINDILDRKKDAIHPIKKNRPIANGTISIKQALFIIFVLFIADLVCLYKLPYKVLYTILLYIFMNILYSIKLKHIVLIDIFVIAIGFILRVYAGAYAISVPVSSYIFMTTLFISLFLGFSKRKIELKHSGATTRQVLKNYSYNMLNQYIIISVALTIMSYALYTLEASVINRFGTHRLIYSIIFVIYGMFRYIYTLDKNKEVEDPTENVLTDKGLIVVCILYIVYILGIFIKLI